MAKYVIIGNGVTGTRAAEVLRRRDASADITIVTEESYPFYYRPQLADYVAGTIDEQRLWGKSSGFYESRDLELRLASRAESLDPVAQTVTLAGGQQLSYDKLLVATGRSLSTGGLKGGDLPGVNSFKTLDEARVIRDLDGEGKTALVYGNGMIALECIRALTSAGFDTTYLVPSARLWADILDEDAAEIAESRVRASGAELILGASVEAVEGGQGSARGLVLQGGETKLADVICVCTSYVPSVDFLPDSGAGFSPRQDFTTPWDNVYAAGDVTVDPSKNYFNWLRSWRHGALAAAALASGEPVTTENVDILNMQVLGLSLVAMGTTIVQYRSGCTQMRGDYPVGEFYKKLVFDPDDVLVGVLLVGNIAEAGVLEEAMARRVRKEDLDPALLHQMFEITYRHPFQGVQCPVCRHEIQLSRGAHEGDLITCPVCGVDFVLKRGPHGFEAEAVV